MLLWLLWWLVVLTAVVVVMIDIAMAAVEDIVPAAILAVLHV